jgi:hypothetical protein
MIGVYLTLVIVSTLFAVAGFDATMRLFAYVDLELRYSWIRFRMYLMKRKLKRSLLRDTAKYTQLIKENNPNDR